MVCHILPYVSHGLACPCHHGDQNVNGVLLDFQGPDQGADGVRARLLPVEEPLFCRAGRSHPVVGSCPPSSPARLLPRALIYVYCTCFRQCVLVGADHLAAPSVLLLPAESPMELRVHHDG